ncbi:MAG: sugar ABC transporter substrate-binding protein [Solirubrobacterales bacterium]
MALLGVFAALTIAGCGGDSSSTSGGGEQSQSETGGNDSPASAQKFADKWYKGSFTKPDVPPVKTVPTTEDIWIVTVGQTATSSVKSIHSVVEASNALGWKTHIYDGKFEQNEFITGMRAAIAAKADAIYVYGIDCAAITAPLEEAKAADIPTISTQAVDCDAEGGEKLFTYASTWSGKSVEQFFVTFGEAQAAWVAANEPEAKILAFVETDVRLLIRIGEGFEKGIEQYCPKCEIIEEVQFTGAELGTKLQEKAEQVLLREPDVTTISGSYDDPVTTAFNPALKNLGKTGQVSVIGGEGSVPNIDLVYEEGEAAGAGLDNNWEGFAAMDAIIRVLAGEDPTLGEKNGLGVQLFDKEHNLPPKGDAFSVPDIDYKAAFYKAWGLD